MMSNEELEKGIDAMRKTGHVMSMQFDDAVDLIIQELREIRKSVEDLRQVVERNLDNKP